MLKDSAMLIVVGLVSCCCSLWALPGLTLAGDESAGDARRIRVAAISLVPERLNVERNARELEAVFRKAAAGGARLAVAPEGVLEGYIVNQILSGEIAAEKMRDVALAIDHPIIRRFQTLARELQMCLVFGFAERVDSDVFNTAVFIDHEGTICGRHHKMQLAEGYHADWWFNRLGTASRAFDTPLGRCGILICNDRWNPALAQIPKLDGAQFLVIPSYGSTSKAQDDAVLARARETGLPVVEANVGVTLIASGGELQAVDRETSAITFGEIEISPGSAPRVAERDQVEQEFLRWRDREMPVRYAQRSKPKPKAEPKPQAKADPAAAPVSAQPLVVDVWPAAPPDEPGTVGAELVRMSPKFTADQVEVTTSTRLITNVTRPTLSIYRPTPERDSGTAILICPGGGYWDLYWELEGEEVAQWAVSRGMTGIILKYRVPRRPDEPKTEPARRPLQDAQRAIRLVRHHAASWGLKPDRLGVMGFSAGGHLAVASATAFEKSAYPVMDAVDEISCRPDFAVGVYSGFLKARDSMTLAPWLSIPEKTPPIFLVHGSVDPISPPSHSVVMYLALQQARIPAELHIYAATTHDFGVRAADRPYAGWTEACERWLIDQKLLLARPLARP